jgi:TolB-like protein
MSSDKEQEYFSDGISEELLNLLAKIPELRVIGRTSSFQFKGKNEDLRSIGQKLKVTHLLEGSVRKSGDKIRLTAQLHPGGRRQSSVSRPTIARQMTSASRTRSPARS